MNKTLSRIAAWLAGAGLAMSAAAAPAADTLNAPITLVVPFAAGA